MGNINKLRVNLLCILKVVFFSFIIFVPFLVSEIYVRLFIPQRIMPRFVESAPWGIRKNLPNVDGIHNTPEFKYRIRTNSQGFRGTREYIPVPPEGIYRIIVMGDSVSLGYGVKEEETYAASLEKLLREENINAEVVNMSISGFGTAEEIIQFQHVGKNYHPNLVILGYFTNDPLNNIVSTIFRIENGDLIKVQQNYQPGIFIRDRLSAIPFYNFFAQHSHLLNLIREGISSFILNKYTQKAASEIDKNPEKHSEYQKELTILLLDTFIEEVEKSGAYLLIIDIPDKSLEPNMPREIKLNAKAKIIDIVEPFRQAKENNINIFYEIDGHPTAKGHEIIAKEIQKNINVFLQLNNTDTLTIFPQ